MSGKPGKHTGSAGREIGSPAGVWEGFEQQPKQSSRLFGIYPISGRQGVTKL